jgi:glycine dehydrogenase subunit 1
MLERIGVEDPMELYRDVPKELILRRRLSVGYGRMLSEWELEVLFEKHMQNVRVFLDPPPFMGGGICPHYVPAAVRSLATRLEFLTAYTPYQPEINQGLLQALYEYQSLMAELTGMDVVNASMYDGSTAVAEAALMAVRVTRRRRIVVPKTMNPEHKEVLRTWLYGKGVVVEEVGFNRETGSIDVNELERKLLGNDVAAVYVEVPSYLGFIDREAFNISDVVHKHGALYVVGVDPLSLALLKPPASYGADIVVGEGQSLGLGMNYGGPLLGIFGVKWDRKLVRQLPGRLIGLTRTVDGKDQGFMMILQTREQHIRREKATSNITTNEALMAVTAAIYISLLGRDGLRELARSIWLRSHYAARRLSELPGVDAPLFKQEFFKEFVASFPVAYREVHAKLLERGILGGLDLSERIPFLKNAALFCVTELHSRHHIDQLVNAVGEILERVASS